MITSFTYIALIPTLHVKPLTSNLFQPLRTQMVDVYITRTVEPLYNGHFGTSHFWVIFAVI